MPGGVRQCQKKQGGNLKFFITCLNDILVPHLKAVFELDYAGAMLIQFSFFSACFIMSLPSGWLVDRVGCQRGMVSGWLSCCRRSATPTSSSMAPPATCRSGGKGVYDGFVGGCHGCFR